MNDLRILVLTCAIIIAISTGTVLLLFVPSTTLDAVERSSIIRNYILTAAAPIGVILALWRLVSIERTLSNDTEKLSIERRMSAVKLLNSTDQATKEVAIDLIDRLRKTETDDAELLTNALYRFFQEEYRKNLDGSRRIFRETYENDFDAAYDKWLNRPILSSSPVRFLPDFAKIKEDRLHFGVNQLSLRGRQFEVDDDIVFWDCDLSDAKIIVNGGCRFISCDLSRSNLILRSVKKTAALSLNHCNVSSLKIEPGLPEDFSLPKTKRSGWFFEGSPPVFGDYFGMPNLHAKTLFSFDDKGSRSVSKDKVSSIILGETSYSSARDFLSPFEQDDQNLVSHTDETTEK